MQYVDTSPGHYFKLRTALQHIPSCHSESRSVGGCSAERTEWEGERVDQLACVQRDVWAFGIAGGWKATASEVRVWVETVTGGVRRFIDYRLVEKTTGERGLWAGTLIRISGGRLPKRIVFRNLKCSAEMTE